MAKMWNFFFGQFLFKQGSDSLKEMKGAAALARNYVYNNSILSLPSVINFIYLFFWVFSFLLSVFSNDELLMVMEL